MEKNLFKPSAVDRAKKEKSCASNNVSHCSEQNEESVPKKEMNSWDCSTPSNYEKIPKGKVNDWDISNCQETMVEPFENGRDLDTWDSESEKNTPKSIAGDKNIAPLHPSSFDSFDLSEADLSDLEKISLPEEADEGKKGAEPKEKLLFVEDLEEFLKDDHEEAKSSPLKTPESLNNGDLDIDSEKIKSNYSEPTLEDSTVWMIPKSQETQSGESSCKLNSGSGKNKSEKPIFLKKTKSLSDLEKNKVKNPRNKSLYECLDSSYSNILVCEGSSLQKKLEFETKNSKAKISVCETFDRSATFFAEYECRAVTMEKEKTEKRHHSGGSPDRRAAKGGTAGSKESSGREGESRDRAGSREAGQAGPSSFLDVISLPDMVGSLPKKERRRDTNQRKESPEREKMKTKKAKHSQLEETNRLNESWFLFDSSGQYQEITRNEVSILLNGRSADAVLQGRKQHFISKATLEDSESLKESLSCLQTEESLQQFLKEEDIGGEDDVRKMIELERKVENTLFYVQPSMNFTASVRIIPLEPEMIHLWKRSRGSGSLISSEVDLSHPSQDSVETSNQRASSDRHHSPGRRVQLKESTTLTELNENRKSDRKQGATSPRSNHSNDLSQLLVETRLIVDSLSDNFKIIQNRLDGETNRSMALQWEVNNLKLNLKKFEGKLSEKNSKENYLEITTAGVTPLSSSSIKEKLDLRSKSIMEECEESLSNSSIEKPNPKSEDEMITSSQSDPKNISATEATDDNDTITVNIYTLENSACPPRTGKAQETYSLVQSNLTMIEDKMNRLQKENDFILKQNTALKRKLKEISQELEKYLGNTSQLESWSDESKELEALRDQVCNLKLELEKIKNGGRNREEELIKENEMMRDKMTETMFSSKKWVEMSKELLVKIKVTRENLLKAGIVVALGFESENIENPEYLSNILASYIDQTSHYLLKLKDENNLFEQTLKREEKTSNESSSLDDLISGYAALVDQCRRGEITSETEQEVMEDYFVVIMEKAALLEEIKILKTENEMLLESQLEHYEKLKQTMITLKDQKSDFMALETSKKLWEGEKDALEKKLKVHEDEKIKMMEDIEQAKKCVESLNEKLQAKEEDIADFDRKLARAKNQIKEFEKVCLMKDELIEDLKRENEQLVIKEKLNISQLELCKNEIQNLESREADLEAELTSSKLCLTESRQEMTNYISHLEALVSSSQESLEKNKLKLKESYQNISRLKSENDVLDKRHQCDVKLFNSTKDELETCKENLSMAHVKMKELEEVREKLLKRIESLTDAEKEKSEALELLTKDYKTVLNEHSSLKEKIEIVSKDKEESLKEQKELINKYAVLWKEAQKLQEKYRSVKSECNERTDLIRYLELMLKENLVDYNNRIGCLEQSISRIIEKIVAFKNGMREKNLGVDVEVRELRHQLEVTYKERKQLEEVVNNYNSLMKQLENEVQEREKQVDELHMRLSLEQKEQVNSKKSSPDPEAFEKPENGKIEELENQLVLTKSQLAECRKDLQNCQTSYENEKKKLELTIAELKSEIKRYQLRIEVMMRNITNCNKSLNGLIMDKRSASEPDTQIAKKEVQERDKLIAELNERINKYKAEFKLKDDDLENLKKKNVYLDEEVKNLQNKIASLQDAVSVTNQTIEKQQKEKDEMAEKLFQSIKLIMEEKTTRQSIENLAMEKEKNYRNQIDQIKEELVLKEKECKNLSGSLEDKKKVVCKLQDELKKIKFELGSYKEQENSLKRRINNKGKGDGLSISDHMLHDYSNHYKSHNVSSERLESCLKELKEIRDLNLQLRKTEGQYQAKIVCLEDEIRDAKLLIKELQGDIKTEKKSKKAFKNMIIAAKMEIEKCLLTKQIMSVVAERISRHLDLSEIPSRELLSGFRLSDSSSPKIST